MLPNFLIIGAEKAGTTWMYERLRRHPDIYMPLTKEIHYFNRYDSNRVERNKYIKYDLKWYKHFFRDHAGEAAVGEVTPMYLCDEDAPARIQSTLPNVRLIVCLRNPVDRAYSHYWMARGKGHTTLTFEEVVRRREPRFIERGCYGNQIARYYNLFDSRDILVLIYEEVFREPVLLLNKISSFLGVKDSFFQDQDWIFERKNKASYLKSKKLGDLIGWVARLMRSHRVSGDILDVIKKVGLSGWIKKFNRKGRKYPVMDVDVRRKLYDYYKPQIKKTENIIGREIGVWNKCIEK